MKKRQKDICLKYNADFVESDPNLNCGLAKQTIGSQPIYGIRHPIEKGTTGWYIWCGEYSADDNFYESLLTKHIEDYLPEVLPYLSLPPGYAFVIDKDGYEDVWFDSKYLQT